MYILADLPRFSVMECFFVSRKFYLLMSGYESGNSRYDCCTKTDTPIYKFLLCSADNQHCTLTLPNKGIPVPAFAAFLVGMHWPCMLVMCKNVVILFAYFDPLT